MRLVLENVKARLVSFVHLHAFCTRLFHFNYQPSIFDFAIGPSGQARDLLLPLFIAHGCNLLASELTHNSVPRLIDPD
ncbi:hypothetical protein HYZ64_03595 [Candidatus Berkelbacteria bacterium]|nr:hypothetical protein [Candidatus Berkelbacteria bacterium]